MMTRTASTFLMPDIVATPVVSLRREDLPQEEKPSFGQVFAAEESPLLRFAQSFVGQRETAEDIVQDAFLKLHAHWEEVTHPRAWLFRCTRNLALSHIRDHRREILMEPDTEWEGTTPNPEKALGKLEAIGALQLVISQLHDDDRGLISLKYQDGLKYDQISQRTGLSVSNVGYKLHHVLKSLADSLRLLGVESAEG
ncbi:MAG: sigma-70 family RNA polymerase sigma factor [Akkermansiaceae bacterium]|nr:sigma-70 family RNA polymerase sigma factor [Akkermansiaceae bacterium]